MPRRTDVLQNCAFGVVEHGRTIAMCIQHCIHDNTFRPADLVFVIDSDTIDQLPVLQGVDYREPSKFLAFEPTIVQRSLTTVKLLQHLERGIDMPARIRVTLVYRKAQQHFFCAVGCRADEFVAGLDSGFGHFDAGHQTFWMNDEIKQGATRSKIAQAAMQEAT